MNTFLTKFQLFIFIIVPLFVAFFLKWYFLPLWLLVSILLLYLFRQEENPAQEEAILEQRSLKLSPCHGVVHSVHTFDHHPLLNGPVIAIQVKQKVWGEMGLRMPSDGEIKEMRQKSYRLISRLFYFEIDRCRDSGINLVIQDPLKKSFALQIEKYTFGLRPKVWVHAGDKGKRGACFGFLPFGGTILIYLPVEYQILVKPGDEVTAAETPIAALGE